MSQNSNQSMKSLSSHRIFMENPFHQIKRSLDVIFQFILDTSLIFHLWKMKIKITMYYNLHYHITYLRFRKMILIPVLTKYIREYEAKMAKLRGNNMKFILFSSNYYYKKNIFISWYFYCNWGFKNISSLKLQFCLISY